jgi:hypothetical protein
VPRDEAVPRSRPDQRIDPEPHFQLPSPAAGRGPRACACLNRAVVWKVARSRHRDGRDSDFVISASAIQTPKVRANLVYRDFTHVGSAKMPDAKTMGRWAPGSLPWKANHAHIGLQKGDRSIPL